MNFFRLIILLNVVAIRRIQVALDFPHKIGDFINYAKAIHESMANSSYFGSLTPKLTELKTSIGNLDDKETGLKTHPPKNTSADRDADMVIVQNHLRALRGDVEAMANDNIEQAEVIVAVSGMHIKKSGTFNKPDFEVKYGNSGTVILVAKGIPHNAGFHNWAMSIDGTNWLPITPTWKATTTVSGLLPASHWQFRHQEIYTDGPRDWTESDVIIIK